MERIYEFNATKIRNILYYDWCRKIYLCHVFKTQTKVSLEIDFFILIKRKSRRQNFNSTAPCQTVRALLRHTAYQCELNFRKDLNVVIQLIWRMHIERTFLFSD